MELPCLQEVHLSPAHDILWMLPRGSSLPTPLAPCYSVCSETEAEHTKRKYV